MEKLYNDYRYYKPVPLIFKMPLSKMRSDIVFSKVGYDGLDFVNNQKTGIHKFLYAN